MVERILVAATFLLLFPSFTVSLLLSLFQSPSLITESQLGVSLSLSKYFLCYCLIYTDVDILLHCTAVCSSINVVYWYQCVASFCWSQHRVSCHERTGYCYGALYQEHGSHLTPPAYCSEYLGLFLLLPMHIYSIFLCLLMSLQSVNISKLVT